MSLQLNEQFESWIGQTLNDASGHKVGKVEDIYTDDETGQPEWLAVHTGLFGSNVSFVPVAGATAGEKGVQVQFPKDQVKDAPNAGSDGKLSEPEEARLYAHYGLDYDQERVRLQRWSEAERADGTRPARVGQDERETLLHDTDDRAMAGSGLLVEDEGFRRQDTDVTRAQPVGPGWADADELELDRQRGLAEPRSERVDDRRPMPRS